MKWDLEKRYVKRTVWSKKKKNFVLPWSKMSNICRCNLLQWLIICSKPESSEVHFLLLFLYQRFLIGNGTNLRFSWILIFSEFERWTEMNALVYHGNTLSRELIREFEWHYNDPKTGFIRVQSFEILWFQSSTFKNFGVSKISAFFLLFRS